MHGLTKGERFLVRDYSKKEECSDSLLIVLFCILIFTLTWVLHTYYEPSVQSRTATSTPVFGTTVYDLPDSVQQRIYCQEIVSGREVVGISRAGAITSCKGYL